MKKKIIFLIGGIFTIVMFITPSVYASGEPTVISEIVATNEQVPENSSSAASSAASSESTKTQGEEIAPITEKQKEESKNLLSKIIDTAFPYIKAFLLGLFDFFMDVLNIVIDFCKTHMVV